MLVFRRGELRPSFEHLATGYIEQQDSAGHQHIASGYRSLLVYEQLELRSALLPGSRCGGWVIVSSK